jgi:hypothetical protein
MGNKNKKRLAGKGITKFKKKLSNTKNPEKEKTGQTRETVYLLSLTIFPQGNISDMKEPMTEVFEFETSILRDQARRDIESDFKKEYKGVDLQWATAEVVEFRTDGELKNVTCLREVRKRHPVFEEMLTLDPKYGDALVERTKEALIPVFIGCQKEFNVSLELINTYMFSQSLYALLEVLPKKEVLQLLKSKEELKDYVRLTKKRKKK